MSSISLTLGLRGRLLSGTQTTLQGALFGNNEPGFTFEPWDISTLYQDRAGTTPVTAAGQSVGLRLDKAQGLRQGPELVTNGSFDADLTGWTLAGVPNPSWSSSVVAMSGTADLRQSFPTTIGKNYMLTFTASGSRGNSFINVGTASGDNSVLNLFIPTTGRAVFTALSTTTHLRFLASMGNNFTLDNISVRELAGNHQVAVSDAKRGVYGWMPKTGRRNLLTYTEQFDNAAWTKANGNVTMSGAVGTFIPTATSGVHYLGQAKDAGTASRTMTVEVKAAGYTKAVLVESINTGTQSRVVDLTNGGFVGTHGGTTVVEPLADGWYRISWTSSGFSQFNSVWGVWPVPDSGVNTSVNIYSQAWTADGVSGIQIRYPHIDLVAGAYQRVNSQYDVTEAGVPTCYYVQADGVDDAYVTPTITPGTDKVQVFAGMRKLSDATTGIFAETSLQAFSSNGSFVVGAPDTGATYSFGSTGSLFRLVVSPATFASPTTNVITGLGDISGDTATLRVNGTQVAQSTSDQGTGNFLAYPAYIYGRGGTSLPFNGLDFGHAVRFGPNLDAATIARVEALIARNTPEVTL